MQKKCTEENAEKQINFVLKKTQGRRNPPRET